MIREQPQYRRDAFCAGLKTAGYKLEPALSHPSPGDILCIWNRYGMFEQQADRFEAAGAKVLVCENGYIGKDDHGRQYYAISVHGHNGSGTWAVGNEDRFSKLGIEVKPWRTEGEHVVVRGQRGIGTKLMASPANWHRTAADRLQAFTKRPIKVVEHPGNKHPKPTGEAELTGAWACVIWASAMGVQALVMGIPVIYQAPYWICEGAGSPRLGEVETPACNDETRDEALFRMAHAQWSVDEIQSGEPFVRLRDHLKEAA